MKMLYDTNTLGKKSLEDCATPKSKLSDEQINTAQHMLQTQFPNIGGLMSVLYSPLADYPQQTESKWLQIIFSPDHWLLVAKGFSKDPDELVVYDSMQFTTSGRQQVLAVMSSLVRSEDADMAYTIAPCQRQASGSNDCGLFAIVFATSLSFGEDPSTRLYDSQSCRNHLKRCYQEKLLSLFPSTPRKVTRTVEKGVIKQPVYCHCRRTDNEYARLNLGASDWEMVQCEKCKEHFHRMCENYPENPKLIWFCRLCISCDTKK